MNIWAKIIIIVEKWKSNMGVDVTIIVKHRLKKLDNLDEVKSLLQEACDKLNDCSKFVPPSKRNIYSILFDPEDDYEPFGIDTDWGGYIRLRPGYWEIESCDHYCQVVMKNSDGELWFRRAYMEDVLAFGETEAWYAEEYYSWNGWDKYNTEEENFDNWLEYAQNTEKGITEYDPEIYKASDEHIPDYEPIYHDGFKDLFEEIKQVNEQIFPYKCLGLSGINENYYIATKDDRLFVIDRNRKGHIIESDYYYGPLCGDEIVLVRNGKSALFDKYLNQMTDYVDGEFKTIWEDEKLQYISEERFIVNETIGVKFKMFDYYRDKE